MFTNFIIRGLIIKEQPTLQPCRKETSYSYFSTLLNFFQVHNSTKILLLFVLMEMMIDWEKMAPTAPETKILPNNHHYFFLYHCDDRIVFFAVTFNTVF